MEVYMKRFAIVGIVALAVLFLGTCGADLSDGNEGRDPEYSDWEYTELPDGTAQLTLYLDGSTPVPVSKNNRALNEKIAKRSHDYFEATFVSGAVVARASWEIGQAAGIRGVKRGEDYGSHFIDASGNGAYICVGRKVSNGIGTLLAVGWVTHTTEPGAGPLPITTISATARSVTFTVSALDTKLGFDFATSGASMDPGTAFSTRDTFLTDALNPGVASGPAASITDAGTAIFKNGATYTMFGLPAIPKGSTATDIKVNGIYKIGLTTALAGGTSLPSSPNSLFDGLKYYPTGSAEGNFQVLERLAIYQTGGQTYDVIEANLDVDTTVAAGSSYTAGDNNTFVPSIPLVFTIVPKSGGAFAFTFQVPVYALVTDATLTPPGPALSTNGGGDAIEWYIRPAHGQPQYLLDDGQNSGGAVLMGVGVGGIDWLEIIVKGFGFTN